MIPFFRDLFRFTRDMTVGSIKFLGHLWQLLTSK